MYYTFVENLHVRPIDIDDLIDGILYLEAKGYIVQKQTAEIKRQK